MVALAAPREHDNPLDLAARLLDSLRALHPSRFARMDVRVCNGAVALTGSVPTYFAKAFAFQGARSVFGESPIIDALEVSDRRFFSVPQTDAA